MGKPHPPMRKLMRQIRDEAKEPYRVWRGEDGRFERAPVLKAIVVTETRQQRRAAERKARKLERVARAAWTKVTGGAGVLTGTPVEAKPKGARKALK